LENLFQLNCIFRVNHAALQKLAATEFDTEFDVVVTDLRMPGIDGKELPENIWFTLFLYVPTTINGQFIKRLISDSMLDALSQPLSKFFCELITT